MAKERKFVVLTTINKPSNTVSRLVAEHQDWKVVVVGDKKTPKDWAYKNVKYLSPDDQTALDYEIVKLLPWNHYSRKMIGYLYAIERGADIIADIDDDNIPYQSWGNFLQKELYTVIDSPPYFNTYSKFSSEFIWPRGYPLNFINLHSHKTRIHKSSAKVGVWQYLVDKDPDVDAIYRLVFNKPISFDKGKSLVLGHGTICPFNSQNTLYSSDVFSLLYLPAFVNFRFTDILRGILAQIIMWKYDYLLGFASPTAMQIRNIHNYLADFESEIPVYLESEKIADLARHMQFKTTDICENLYYTYKELSKNNFVNANETKLVKAWCNDIKKLQ